MLFTLSVSTDGQKGHRVVIEPDNITDYINGLPRHIFPA